jgi:gamma-glutamylcyclotransferase (GGCT)/AIG2-like uncharacterized protein YtfP
VLNLLFVYGTLRSGFENRYARLLRSEAGFVGRATVRGSIYRIGHYAAYKGDPDGEVHGELYRLQNPEMTLRVLDEYEGQDFERITVGTCWLYRYLPEPSVESRISSGDFCAQ